MASNTNATPQTEELPKEGGPEISPDSPLLDLSDAAVKKLIRSAKKRGYVTRDQINAMLSSDEVKSEQIEDILAMFSGMCVVHQSQPRWLHSSSSLVVRRRNDIVEWRSTISGVSPDLALVRDCLSVTKLRELENSD